MTTRIAVVTGGNRGIGFAICRALAEAGFVVALTGRRPDLVTDAAGQLANDGLNVHPYVLDVTDAASVNTAVEAVVAEHGRVDVLIANAGIAADRRRPAHDPDFGSVAETLDTNLLGVWRCVTAVVPYMRKEGRGRIVTVTSHMSLPGTLGAGSASYRVSKTALNALTVVLADELRGTGVLVNAYSPGVVATRMVRSGQVGRAPADAVDTALWLATLPDDGPTGQVWYDRNLLPW